MKSLNRNGIGTLTRPSATLSAIRARVLSAPSAGGGGEGSRLRSAICSRWPAACAQRRRALRPRREVPGAPATSTPRSSTSRTSSRPSRGTPRRAHCWPTRWCRTARIPARRHRSAEGQGPRAPRRTRWCVPDCRGHGRPQRVRRRRSRSAGPTACRRSAKADMQVAHGRALLGLERAAEAKPQFEAALHRASPTASMRCSASQRNVRNRRLPAAKAVMDKASADIQKKPQYWMAMGGISAQGGDFAAAEQAYQKARVEKGGEGRRTTDGARRARRVADAPGQGQGGRGYRRGAQQGRARQPAGQAVAGPDCRAPAATSTRRARCSKKPLRRCPTTTRRA